MDPLLSPLSRTDLEALLLLNRTPGIRVRSLRPFLDQGLLPSEILEQIRLGVNSSWKDSLAATQKVFNPEKEIEVCAERGIEIIPLLSEPYPALLKEISDPPLLLYRKGTGDLSDEAAVAVVGSRHPSLYGLDQARRFSQKLATWGFTIVSGFARGIDRSAHEGALQISYGRTIAVLGSGLDVIYPKEHQALYEEISERGAVLSEFALGTPPLAENFPKRNRIIAGLSLGVFVVEAHSRSGSLITAHLANEEGREVFALPGRVDQLGSRGTHRLIKEGALLTESAEEILETLEPQLRPLFSQASEGSTEPDTDEKELQFLASLNQALTLDELIRERKCAVSEASGLLTRLELKGLVRKRSDGRYERQIALPI